MPNKSFRIIFSPKEPKEEFIIAAKEYQQIWDEDGEKIIQILEKYSTLPWIEEKIEGYTFEAPSHSHPLELRSSYPLDVKKASLVHELGHRLIASSGIKPKADFDTHNILNLFLYDVWIELYGKEFADRMVQIESSRKGLHDYEGMWQKALALNKKERQLKLKDLLEDMV